MAVATEIPDGVYGGIKVENDKLFLSVIGKRYSDSETFPIHGEIETSILSAIKDYSDKNNVKFVGIGIEDKEINLSLYSKLWLDLDIVPLQATGDPAVYAQSHFDKNNSFAAKVDNLNKVETPPIVSLENYEIITPPDEYSKLLELSKEFKRHKAVYISATPQGGGVAIMRHALIRLFKLLNLDIDWHVLIPDAEIFDITKQKFHNVLQSVNPDGMELTDEDKQKFVKWSEKNFELLLPVIEKSDLVVIDDPQPSGLVSYIKALDKNIKIIYRSHIQLQADLANTQGTAQYKTWQFIWSNIKDCDLFISHPVDEFVPKEIPANKLLYMPPSTDPLDGLNKALTDDQKSYYMAIFNNILISLDEEPLDIKRPYIIQIARFDPSKGIPDVIESYAKLVDKMDHEDVKPQLVIVGNSSVDDPDGKPIFDRVMTLINDKYESLQQDIKVVRAPHYDQMLNALLRNACLALQLSHKEGYEFKVTEAVMKGIPTIIYDVGGMPLQIKHDETGYIVPKGNTDLVAKYMLKLLSDNDLYRQMSMRASQEYEKSATTVPNALKWLQIFNDLIQ